VWSEQRVAAAHTALAEAAEEESRCKQLLLQLARSGRGKDAAQALALLPWRTARLLEHLRTKIFLRLCCTAQGIGLVAMVDVPHQGAPLLEPNCLPNGACVHAACLHARHRCLPAAASFLSVRAQCSLADALHASCAPPGMSIGLSSEQVATLPPRRI
jgi:hypothetical protein